MSRDDARDSRWMLRSSSSTPKAPAAEALQPAAQLLLSIQPVPYVTSTPPHPASRLPSYLPPPIPHISLTTHHRGHDSTLLFFPFQSQPNRPSYPFRNSSNSCRSPFSPPWAPFARVSVSEAERSRLVPHQISYYACSR